MLLHERPYLDVWLKRTRRQLAPSGRLTELALILSRRKGRDAAEWSATLRSLLDGETEPTLDLVTLVDAEISRPRRVSRPCDQALLL